MFESKVISDVTLNCLLLKNKSYILSSIKNLEKRQYMGHLPSTFNTSHAFKFQRKMK
jgi:hypothetical protein